MNSEKEEGEMKILRHKYNAQPTEVDGMKFGSKKEAAYYRQLNILQKSGEIVGFFRQTPLHLPGNIKYVMDFFVFYSNGTCEGIEVKGFETKIWKIKQKLIKTHYPWVNVKIVK